MYGFAQSRFLSFFCSPKSLTKSNIFCFTLLFIFTNPFLSFFLFFLFLSLSLSLSVVLVLLAKLDPSLKNIFLLKLWEKKMALMKIYGFAQSRFVSFFHNFKSLTKSNIFVLFFLFIFTNPFLSFFFSFFLFLFLFLYCWFCWPSQTHH